MKKLVLAILLCNTVQVFAKSENQSNDFTRSTSEIKPLAVEDLAYRLHITGEIFIASADGETLINKASEFREWEFGGQAEKPIESNWRFQQAGLPLVALKQNWTLEKSGKLKVEISQYEDIDRGPGREVKYGKLIKTEKFTIKNFAPIDWLIASGSQKLIVRLTPGLWNNNEAKDVGALPFGGKNVVIYDQTGKLWADQVSVDRPSAYFGVTTRDGSLFLSFVPFKGAKLVGEAKGGRIKIVNGKNKVVLQSETSFVPADIKANVYGFVREDLRTERLNSVRTFSSDKEEDFLRRL